MTIEVLKEKETQEMLKKLSEQFGIQKIPGILLKKGRERIFLFRGEVSEKQIEELNKLVQIERAGIYIGQIFAPSEEIRLSLEGTQIFKDQITKNYFELNETQAQHWMQGEELQIKTNMKGIIAVKYKDEYLGCGKASEEKIGNFIPKARRLKSKDIIR